MSQLPNKNLPWPITWDGVVEIANSEGLRHTAYKDIVGVWTIGWGRTRDVFAGMQQTKAEADNDLLNELVSLAAEVKECLERPANKYEFAAMVSLAYNVGMGWKGSKKPAGAKNGFRQSSILRAHNRGDKAAAARAFSLWNKAGGKVIQGLVNRRSREAALYLSPVGIDISRQAAPATPDADAESRLRDSPIAQSGAVSIGTGILAAASSVSGYMREVSENLSIDPILIVALVAIGVGAVVLYQRFKQRREGWA